MAATWQSVSLKNCVFVITFSEYETFWRTDSHASVRTGSE